jgi:hypothetical protein
MDWIYQEEDGGDYLMLAEGQDDQNFVEASNCEGFTQVCVPKEWLLTTLREVGDLP